MRAKKKKRAVNSFRSSNAPLDHKVHFMRTRRQKMGALYPVPGGATAQRETARSGCEGSFWRKTWKIENESAKGSTYSRTATAKGNRNRFRKKALLRERWVPLRAPTFVRTTTRFDYQPNVCKDYKETGYCGYGDNCIYLHDRGDYLSGWQMEKAWQEKRRNQQERMRKGQCVPAKEDAASKEKDEKVSVCVPHLQEVFTKPVETVCGHYFAIMRTEKVCEESVLRCLWQKKLEVFSIPPRVLSLPYKGEKGAM